jgi:hypothetical protein
MLSPSADRFYPSLGRRTKNRWWADDDNDESDNERPSTYLEAAHRPARPAVVSPVHAEIHLAAAPGRGGVDTGQKHARRRSRRSQLRP